MKSSRKEKSLYCLFNVSTKKKNSIRLANHSQNLNVSKRSTKTFNNCKLVIKFSKLTNQMKSKGMKLFKKQRYSNYILIRSNLITKLTHFCLKTAHVYVMQKKSMKVYVLMKASHTYSWKISPKTLEEWTSSNFNDERKKQILL